jgi:hypothetical protein
VQHIQPASLCWRIPIVTLTVSVSLAQPYDCDILKLVVVGYPVRLTSRSCAKIQFVSLLIVVDKSLLALPSLLSLPSLTPSLLFCFYLTAAMSSYSYFSNQTQRYSAAAVGNSSSGGSQVVPLPNGASSGGSSGDPSIRPARTPSVSSWSRLSLSVANDKDGNGLLGGSAGTEGARSVHPLRST